MNNTKNMKNRILTFGIMLAAAFAAVSCVKNDVPEGEEGEAQGTFRLSKIEFSQAVEILHNNTRAGISTDDFNVCITRTGKGTNHLDCKYCDMPESLTLPVGEYRIDVKSHAVQDAEWDKPYYAASDFFEIEKNQTTEIGELVCKLANIMVSVSFTDNSLDLMGEDAVVGIRIGSAWLYYGLMAGRTDAPYSQDNYRFYKENSGFFKAREVTAENPEYDMLYWEFSGDVEDEFLEDAGTIANVKAGEHHKLKFDINRTPIPGEETGSAEFIFTVNVEIESYDLNLNLDITEEFIGELEQAVEFGSTHSFAVRNTLKATETMTGGEVTTPVNMTLDAAKGLRNVFMELSTDNPDLAAAFTAKGLDSAFDLASPGAAAGGIAELGLPSGVAVAGKTLLTLDLKALIKLAFECGGANELDIKVTAYDSDSDLSTKTLRFKLVDDSVPADITIEWIGNDIDARHTLRKSEVFDDEGQSTVPVVVDVQVPNGIQSFVVKIISDINGLDKTSLTDLGLDDEFDLVAPHDVKYEGDLEEMLKALNFPVKDEVKDQTSIQVDITEFIPLIFLLDKDGKADFRLTVTDNLGNIETKTIQLDILVSE